MPRRAPHATLSGHGLPGSVRDRRSAHVLRGEAPSCIGVTTQGRKALRAPAPSWRRSWPSSLYEVPADMATLLAGSRAAAHATRAPHRVHASNGAEVHLGGATVTAKRGRRAGRERPPAILEFMSLRPGGAPTRARPRRYGVRPRRGRRRPWPPTRPRNPLRSLGDMPNSSFFGFANRPDRVYRPPSPSSYRRSEWRDVLHDEESVREFSDHVGE